MNCKPGDLAVVVVSDQGNNGALVHVVRDSGCRDSGAFWWECELLCGCTAEAQYGTLSFRAGAGDIVLVADSSLRPIRDQDGEDEILRIAGKPLSAPKTTETPRPAKVCASDVPAVGTLGHVVK